EQACSLLHRCRASCKLALHIRPMLKIRKSIPRLASRCYNQCFARPCTGTPAMPIDWAPFVELVRRHQRFLLTTHIRPDGDALGSILALGEVLRLKGKQVRLVNASAMPARYAFLDP